MIELTMIEDQAVDAVADVLTLFGAAERPRSKLGSKTTSKAAGEGVRSTQAQATKLTAKQLGEIAEACFLDKALRMGFAVAKPWGDSEPYDFIVNQGRNLWRVQVKSAHVVAKDGSCGFRAQDSQRSYSAEDIDALAAYAKPADAWYVMPASAVEDLKSLRLYPNPRKKKSKYERWREAWQILRGAVPGSRKK